ncbi:poly-gamma-glutamate biosynthesis protein PgsC/CapC [Kibdelosporangium philippinense]|uniref:Poly-gamma-glutamate biosynthesis protein PgsC/CapC n=1 Tax=Kibdelosporangium philippinense TaxID=211113 RepID=A0ABS8Z8Q4_9PSEU|nr:poly-gamma-glutamate biosynthesis protein PgsC/CapC [Kibdelosporangium philippinense]MCE7002232.1 poly-gamma-glutamate biosynthesis protein PgsC/CapC [Kibdelosporangium philippinense]
MTTRFLAAEVATIGLAIGLLLALICVLVANLSPGGMISPGWLALTLIEDYRRAAIIVLMTALTYGGTKVMRRFAILYGKRLFAAIVLLAVLLQSSLFLLIQHDYPLLFAHQTLGFVVPGLIAYQLVRQPPVATLLVTSAVSLATCGVLVSGVLVGLVPTI